MDYDKVEELEKQVEKLTKQVKNQAEAIDFLFEVDQVNLGSSVEIFESLMNHLDNEDFEKEARAILENVCDNLEHLVVNVLIRRINLSL